MNEKQKAFMELAESNEELKAKIEALAGKDVADAEQAIIDLARAYGLELSEDDLKVSQELGEEIDDDELEAVAGGIVLQLDCEDIMCECLVGGGGHGMTYNGVTYPACACVLGGGGVPIRYGTCACVGYGTNIR